VPEGDTVYRHARALDRALVGRRLERAELRVPSLAAADLVGTTVLGNQTWGKHLLTRFDNGLTLHTHLRMDGTWTVIRPSRRPPRERGDRIRVLYGTEDGHTVLGERIPVIDLVRSSEEDRLIGHLGPDPLRPDWDAAVAAERLAAEPDRAVVVALGDQRCLAGLGNFWVNEVCFLRGYSPWTPVGETDVTATIRLAARALRASVTVPGMYQVTTGNRRLGEHQWIYGRADLPCRRCGTRVQVDPGTPNDPERRRTWWCPHCQPGPGPDGSPAS